MASLRRWGKTGQNSETDRVDNSPPTGLGDYCPIMPKIAKNGRNGAFMRMFRRLLTTNKSSDLRGFFCPIGRQFAQRQYCTTGRCQQASVIHKVIHCFCEHPILTTRSIRSMTMESSAPSMMPRVDMPPMQAYRPPPCEFVVQNTVRMRARSRRFEP